MARKIDNRQSKSQPGADVQVTDAKDEITLAELDKVSGGETKDVKASNIGSQSSGAGAGKVVFNPF